MHSDPSPAVRIADAVTRRVKSDANSLVGIEDVQDMVQEELMKQGHYAVASHYILYRAERAKLRSETTDDAPALSEITVINGRAKTSFDPVEIRRRIAYASTGLDLCLSKKEITKELLRSVGGEISKEDLKNTIILNAKTLLEKDADFGKFAGRILLTYIYEEVLDWDILRDGLGQLKKAHRAAFAANLKRGVKIGRVDPVILERYDLDELASKLDPSADMDFDYLGIQTLYDRYLIVDKTGRKPRRLETPQFFWMRVAMGLFKEEGLEDRYAKPNTIAEHYAVRLYNLYKSRRFCSSTPTLFNSGTPHSQLSSCYISVVGDDIESIFQRGIADSAYMAKYAGGLGGSWTNVRGTGAHIKGTNGESQGIIPFLKIYNDMLNAVNQGGKRRGSGCNYLETWHNDIEDFLELRKNVGDDRRRCHDMNTAHWIPDLFMKRMEARQDWTLFRSNEVSDLHDLYGQAFDRRYEEYEAMAAAGKIWSKTLPALELWKAMLKALFETGHPWITFKDPCNVRSPQDHVGVVHSSNLCCMTADQRVVTERGIMTVGEMYRETVAFSLAKMAPPLYRVMGRKGQAVTSEMLLPRPDAPIVKIKTREGYSHKVTPDHKVWVKDVGWVEAQNLTPGDKLEIQQREGMWGDGDNKQLAFLAGLVAGDGGIGDTAYIDITEGKTMQLRAMIEANVCGAMRGYGHEIFGPGNATSPDSPLEPMFTDSTPSETNGAAKARLHSLALKRLLALHGMTAETKTRVPEFVWKGGRQVVGHYLAGLLVTDATIQATDEITTIQLGSVDLTHLEEVQILLANMGVKCSIRKMRDAGKHLLPANNGSGELKEYDCQAMHRLLITSQTACRIVESYTKFGELRGHEQFLSNLVHKTGYKQKLWATFEGLEELPNEDAYCLTVANEDHDWTVNGMITKNTEITLNTSPEEIAVCNLGSVLIDEHLLPDGNIDHDKLKATITLAVRALDNVIDINFYPVEATRTSNSRHRPIGLGMMGLQNALHKKGLAFASQEAVEFNDEITEAVAYYAYLASSQLAREKGAYSTYKGSKWDRGILPQDSVDLLQEERGAAITTPRGGLMNWDEVRASIAEHGMRNSNVMAIAPTATISNIMATTPCIEPNYKNLFVKSNMSGDFTVLSETLVRELKALGLWGQSMLDQLKYYDGELSAITEIPDEVKARHLTVFGIPYEYIIDAAARRQKWIDQAQSLNLFLPEADMKTLSRMYRYAWSSGLKTTYYLRTLGASSIEKSTVDAGKALRGLVAEAAPVMQCRLDDPTCESCQ
jgi:ribonucleoside-diphosphate reductase alpha chain